MANERIKISQLTPKGANLASTDLLEISEFDGSGYVTRSITGQEIIDAAGGGTVEWGNIVGVLSAQTDLQGVLDNKFNVPSGNTSQYLDGAGTPTAFPTFASADKMVTVGRNSTGSTLYKGTIVYISGSTGNRPNFVKAQANSEATSAGTFGVIEADIPNNSDGNCVTIGTIDNLDTRTTATNPFTIDTLADGDTIYLSPLVAGYVTNVKPSAPYHLVYIGKVVRTSPTNGTIVYRIQNGYELEELHNVAITSVADNNIIQYDSATSLWKNESLSTAGIQPTLVSGTSIKTINGSSVLGSGDLSISSSASWGGITGTLSSQTDLNTALNAKQDTLVSGTNIKTINSTSLVGSGNVSVQPTLVAGTNIKYVNGFSLLGSGDLLTPVGTHGFIKPQSGQYMASGMFGTTTSYGANTGVAGRLMVYPFIPSQDISIQALAMYVNTGVAGALARIVMYTSSTTNGGNYPSIKSFESTDLDCSTTGLKTAGNIITLSKGTIYWLGVHVSSTAGILNILQSSCIALGFNGVTQTYSSLQVSNTYGSLPSGFPAGASYQTTAPYHVFLQMV